MKKPIGVIAFLTDIGYKDHYAASIIGVALNTCLDIKIVSITHGIPSFDIYEAAFILLASYRYFPKGTIFVVVVVPSADSSKNAILIVTKNYFFIGPDNGVLIAAGENDGIEQVLLLNKSEYFRNNVSATFPGRDIYTPVAAQLACGTPLQSLGTLSDP
ncbi:MAG: hypothetical protein DRO40_12130, partial [Thermoprotei archaeon]